MSTDNIAIITARGGSKRIPRKNIKEFCGEPIINYSIKAALNSGLFDEVMVSTDDAEIAEISKKAGAKVPFLRSEKTSNDFATTSDVLMEVFEKYKELGKEFTYACCLYPTAPFITPEKLKKGFSQLVDKNADVVMPVIRFSFPPQRGLIIQDGKIKYKWPENSLKRSQDLEPMYHDCGQFYFYNVKNFIHCVKNGIASENVFAMELSDIDVQDIDNFEDWENAEIKYRILKEKGLI